MCPELLEIKIGKAEIQCCLQVGLGRAWDRPLSDEEITTGNFNNYFLDISNHLSLWNTVIGDNLKKGVDILGAFKA